MKPIELKEFVNAIGAICEVCGLMRDNLIRCGFTREEACEAVYRYIVATFTTNNTEEKNDEEN